RPSRSSWHCWSRSAWRSAASCRPSTSRCSTATRSRRTRSSARSASRPRCAPMARFGEADEIAGGAVYLASDAASFVNGHTLVIDGGFLACGVGDSVAPWEDDD
ncbi:MAG: SDR family oxidoreductase, partial [Phycisphaeraceae bacterium]|nr:SDR family oxidoreductase [Phycisphaeraceae bacterium]